MDVEENSGKGEDSKPGPENLDDTVITEAIMEKPTSQSKLYKSFEERIFVDTGIKDFVGEFAEWGIKSAYGCASAFLRAPTAIRRKINKQSLLDRWNPSKKESFARDFGEGFGGILGGIVGGLSGISFTSYCIATTATQNNNYLPLAGLLATNVAFGIYELGRFRTSKQEYLEMKAQQTKSQAEKEARLERKGSGGGGN